MELSEFRKYTEGVWNSETRCYRGWNKDIHVITVDVYRASEGRKQIEYSAGIWCEEIDGDFEEWLLDNFYEDNHAVVCECWYRDSAEVEIDYHNQSVDIVDYGDAGGGSENYIINTGAEIFSY